MARQPLVIRRGRPAPRRSPRLAGLVAKMREMRINDHITVPKDKRNSVYTSARSAGIKIAVRTEGEDATVWRVE